MKKICIVTGGRSEYGLLRWVMEGINRSFKLKLQIIVTGSHLSAEFGSTFKKIEDDGFNIDKKVEMLLNSDSAAGITKSMGLGLIGFADAFAELKPDLVLVLGDRYEIFTATSAAMIFQLPIAHIHGGELTEGAFDDSIRHSITKMAHLHFVAAEVYQKRVIQLGEQPKNVFLVGGLGVDSMLHIKLMKLRQVEKSLNFKFLTRNLLITFHPVTLELDKCIKQIDELLESLAELKNIGLIFTMPNADNNNRLIFHKIQDFCLHHPHSKSYVSMGQELYFSCLKHVDGVIGNSSSGLLEAPSFKKGTINIGDRQRGRLRAASVIDCDPNRNSISDAIKKLFSAQFKLKLKNIENPYGSGGSSKTIVKILERKDFKSLLKKRFYDL
ncbi:UDP-N-acetylglucosamine 2-epimerase (hydrolyzing) [Candidatus Methylopumilus rimovensis]|uniref:UDP-N-acetylglucosamine 2-epimerase (Hydrolyzing) n=1 Tax=Candidatus Methylopumilus rimovensis TaxID=2588535 RepID=A0AAE6KP89_9PROT|nr:UDP-N-acetylglucosamine 2-epimerase [Candidatus Methylopumilus rimovensis]QDD13367.1 UDP-N-acetylglucosamine 2-epimerase (hydrolyzing) [Candidatus Methylopumilus rimovensis]